MVREVRNFCKVYRDGAGVHNNYVRKKCNFATKSQDKKTYPEVVSHSMPRTLKDFRQRACSQKNPQGPPRKKIRTAQVCGLRTVHMLFARFYGFRTVRKLCYRPGSAVLYRPHFVSFKPSPLASPADNARLCQMGPL